ncbi:dienelactone hydrolase family protein [Sphingomonas abietis]|uniref:Dienelactone hydrolase family protein n=1 Tax=Sphingomonas abietis TaxID=3012344 RepID=A0ABY7NKX1_9SPHN|nr:dienelactone hydrolase family protein [Sphingomonas abietis]WBO22144.1 dienelactone hydrolase family protein [Sphingomonas abietis]
MAQEQVTIHTADGDCPTYVVTPEGTGPWPAVIIYMDALGMRPALLDIATRLADNGYLALLPDLFYRSGEYHIPTPTEVFASGEFMKIIGPLMAVTGPDKAAADTRAYLDYLDTRSDVKGGKVGVVGFCMGGGMALATAGTYPDRVAAAASYHGGNLATDQPNSPHLLAPQIKAEVYVAGADNDHSYTPEMHERLKAAFDAAGLTYRAEIYPGALHGWMKPDFPIYDKASAERGWKEMLDLFSRNLG